MELLYHSLISNICVDSRLAPHLRVKNLHVGFLKFVCEKSRRLLTNISDGNTKVAEVKSVTQLYLTASAFLNHLKWQ